MYGIAAGLVVLGVLCGTMVRLMPFVIILVVAAAVAVVTSWPQAGIDILLNAVITIVALQAGYAIGIVARALLHAWRGDRRRILRRRSQHDTRLPTEQRHR